MRTAQKWGVPPLTVLRGGNPREWTDVDRVLAMAATLAEDLTCPGCGQPKHAAWNPDSEGWYESREATCQGCAELARAASGDRDPRPEVRRWVVDTRPPGVELRPWDP